MSAKLEAHGAICATDPCQLCEEAQRRIRAALEYIETAQSALGDAMEHLSSLQGCLPEWNTANRIYDRIHSFWYRVERKRKGGKFQLDGIASEALKKKEGLR